MKIIMNSRNYQILKTFIGKMSMELIDVNSVRKYTQIRGISEFVFPFYHAIFYDNKTFEHSERNLIEIDFELEKKYIDYGLDYFSKFDSQDIEFFLKENKLNYLTIDDIMYALVELIMELRLVTEED